jgi:F-type H+-transporting ATPase subunit b
VQQMLSAAAAVSAAAAKTVNPIIPNGTFIVEFLAFFLILWFLARKVVPLISASMTKRQELIRSQIDDSRLAKERLEAAEAEYKQALADNRTEAARIREEARVQGQQIIEEMRTQAQEEAVRISEREHSRLETERQLVLTQLRVEVGELALDLATRIVGHELSSDQRQSQLVNDFINGLEAAPPGDTLASAPAAAPSAAGN